MTLKDCKVGDFVIVWCIGWRAWDNEVLKIIEKGFYVTLENRSGVRQELIDSCVCKPASW